MITDHLRNVPLPKIDVTGTEAARVAAEDSPYVNVFTTTPKHLNELRYERGLIRTVNSFINKFHHFPTYVKIRQHGRISRNEIIRVLNYYSRGSVFHIPKHSRRQLTTTELECVNEQLQYALTWIGMKIDIYKTGTKSSNVGTIVQDVDVDISIEVSKREGVVYRDVEYHDKSITICG